MIFIIMSVVGLALLLFSFIFDGLFDFIDFDIFDNGLLSMTGLAAFVTLFGLTGYVCDTTGQPPLVTALAASGAGLAGLIFTGLGVRFMKNQSQPDNAYDNASMVGRSAVVVSGANPGDYGTVAVSWNGMTENIAALSEDTLVKGQAVTITHVLSHSSVRVEKIVKAGALDE